MKRLSVGIVLSVIVATFGMPAVAQYAYGDVLVSDLSNLGKTWRVLGVKPGGSAYTVTTSLPFVAWSIAPAPDNRTVWVAGRGIGTFGTSSIAPDGTITRVNVDQSKFFSAIDVDGRGNTILTDHIGAQLYEYSNSQLSTIYSGAPLSSPAGGGLDLASGDMVVVQPNGIYRINRFGAPRATTVLRIAWPSGPAVLHADPATGMMVGSWSSEIYGLTFGVPNRLTTLANAVGVSGLDRDPATGLFVTTRSGSIISPAREVLRFDATNRVVTTLTTLGPSIPYTCTIAGSRHLAGISTASPGQRYQLRVSSPREPGSFYAVAASFGTRGIQLQRGKTVYLTLDALFNYSLTNSGIFSGFQGRLDTAGEAIATMRIPNLPALRGLRLYTAAVTLSTRGISVVSDPVGTTIR